MRFAARLAIRANVNEPMQPAAVPTAHARPQPRSRAQAGYFLRHFVQMVLAMAAGMAIFIGVFRALLTPGGYLALQTRTPLLWFAGMGFFMAVPMIGWMRYYQRHSRRECAEMTVAMLLPPASIAALVQAGVVAYPWLAASTLSASTHMAMLLGMIAAMLYRRDQYARPRC